MNQPEHLPIEGTRWARISYDQARIDIHYPATHTSMGGDLSLTEQQAKALYHALDAALLDLTARYDGEMLPSTAGGPF